MKIQICFFLVEIPRINITEEIPFDEEEADIQFQSSEFFKMLKATTIMNLLTLIFSVALFPIVIHGMLNHNCKVINGECDTFSDKFVFYSSLQFLCLLLQSVVVLKRLV